MLLKARGRWAAQDVQDFEDNVNLHKFRVKGDSVWVRKPHQTNGEATLRKKNGFLKMKIEIYTKSNCPNCVSAKALLDAKGFEYDEYDVEAEAWALKALLEGHPNARQMPQIFINNQRVGGFAGLQAALKELGI